MSDDLATKLLPAMDIAAFKRAPDGSFAPIAPSPRWFDRLVADTTFPFLGHILEEATTFWQGRTLGSREWGPCVEENEVGREFHYRVLAVTAEAGQFLVFQLDSGADRMREVPAEGSSAGARQSRIRRSNQALQGSARGAADERSNARIAAAAAGQRHAGSAVRAVEEALGGLRRSHHHRRRSGLLRRGRSRVEGSLSFRPPHAIRDPAPGRDPPNRTQAGSASPRAVRVHLLRGGVHRPRQHWICRDGAAAGPGSQSRTVPASAQASFFLPTACSRYRAI